MNRTMLSALAAGAMSLLSVPALAGGDAWIQDFAAAKDQAAKEGKDLLMDFTGSDWCGWCIKLDKEVFSTDTFLSAIQKEYVLVKLDYPRNKELVTPEVAEQNEQLQAEFGIEGFPTIYLADAEGRPFGKTGYQEGGPEKYLEHLASFKAERAERDRLLAEAAGASGVAKAKLLDQALSKADPSIAAKHFRAQVDEIIALDADDAAALKSKYRTMLGNADVQTTWGRLAQAQDWPTVVTSMEEIAGKYQDLQEVAQQAKFFAGIGWLQQGTKQGAEGAEPSFDAVALQKGLDVLNEAQKLAPDSEFAAQQLGPTIEQVKSILERAKGGEGGGG